MNGGLSDYFDPGFNGQKIAGYATGYDVQRILDAVRSPVPDIPETFFAEYRTTNIIQRLEHILTDINRFFDYQRDHASDIPELTPRRIWSLRVQQLFKKAQKKLAKRS